MACEKLAAVFRNERMSVWWKRDTVYRVLIAARPRNMLQRCFEARERVFGVSETPLIDFCVTSRLLSACSGVWSTRETPCDVRRACVSRKL